MESSVVTIRLPAAESLRKRKQSDVEAGLSANQKKKQLKDRSLSSEEYSLRVHPAKCVPFQIGGKTHQTHGRLAEVCQFMFVIVIISVIMKQETEP